MEYGSYHAIVACVAAGAGVALVPRSVLKGMKVESEIRVQSLPGDTGTAKTHLVWRAGHRSAALEALNALLG
jgi:DNA-binding transcriptional LysR family regulator